MLDNSLLQPYEQTSYCFDEVTLNIGKPSKQMAEILQITRWSVYYRMESFR